MTTRADERTVRGAVDGDPAAQRALVEAFGPRVQALCARLDPDPDDARQAAWERILAALPRFDPRGSGTIAGWIVAVTHRLLVDRHRRRVTRGVVLPLDGLAADVDAADAVADRRQRLERALGTLDPDVRRVVVLHHVYDVPLDEIAAAEGVAVGTVKSRLHRGRARLLARLSEGGP
jgi:RNA polymerase sigma-70 factor (ECF subfamily)